jgi:TetR/AcrR family transcriptional regulator
MSSMGTSVPPASPSNKNLRSRQREETRALVIDAAIELFSRRGFDGTALPAIATASGIAVPLIIYHFKSKELLWRAAVDAVYARLDAHLEQFRAQIEAAEGLDFYRHAARAHVTALATCPEYMRILFQEGTQASERLTWLVETHQNRITARLTAIIDRAQREGLVPAMDLAHAKFIYSGAFSLPIVLAPEYRLVTGEDSQSDAFIEAHIDACLRLLIPGADWADT